MDEILVGSWGNEIKWAVSFTERMPPRELVTAVFCVAITNNREIILAQSKRGWGMIGGHVEPGESIEDALCRESIEDGGFTPFRPQLFAIMEITPNTPILRPNSTTKFYPFPKSYQLYYWAKSNLPIIQPKGEEIIESKPFSIADTKSKLVIPDLEIVKQGYRAYLSSK